MAATPGKPPAKLAPFPAVTGLKRFLAGAIGTLGQSQRRQGAEGQDDGGG